MGAPLAIVLASVGLRALVYDVNREALRKLESGRMPFLEHGAEPLLREALDKALLSFSSDIATVAEADTLIVAIGTPIDEFHNPQLDAITRCVDQMLPFMDADQTLILRSTVYPGGTEYVDRYLRRNGRPMDVAFCPERVVQGWAIRELQALPQIVSGITPRAERVASDVFGQIAPSIVPMEVREAEFAKLISNAYRYIQFAATNQFYMMVESAGLDYGSILAGMKKDYPRLRDLPGPGFAAGPCLMKDTMQLAAFNNTRFLLGNSAVTINEGLPDFLVERLAARRDLTRCKVGILGMAFKADVDDVREALSYKLAKILRFHGAEVRCSDEFACDPTFVSVEEVVSSCDPIIVGVPHSRYRDLVVPRGTEVIDLWGVLRSSDQ